MLNDQVRAHELGSDDKKKSSSIKGGDVPGKRLHETVATLIPMDDDDDDEEELDNSGLSQDFSEEEEQMSDSEVSDDESDGNDKQDHVSSLQTMIESLDARDKKSSSASNKQKKSIENVTEACEESEYNISSNAAPDSKKRKLDINDLMGVLSDTTGFGGLKKQLEILDSRDSSNGGTVSAPLAKRAQDKIERDVAYTKAKSEIKKWVPIVSKNRIAENLSFPMNAAPDYKTSNGELVSKFEVSFVEE